jgi:hypothetical protein
MPAKGLVPESRGRQQRSLNPSQHKVSLRDRPRHYSPGHFQSNAIDSITLTEAKR